ncbi:MAG: DUF1127 domain-containing protein [Paracoccaceae bacterium]
MAHVITTTHSHIDVVGAVSTAVRKLADRLHDRRVYRKTRDELMALSDHELRDLGLSRYEIDRVALEASIGSAH